MSEGLSVIVCSLNGRARVDRFIAPLWRSLSQLEMPCELVIVDDGSTDGTAEAIRCVHGDITVVEHRENRGASAARNTGTLAARHEWLLFCDDDLEIDVEALRALWERRGVGVCLVPEVRGPAGDLQNAVTWEWRRLDLKLDDHDTPVMEDLAYPMAACFLVAAEALHRAGGFDERIRHYYEDTELGFALRRAGTPTRQVAGVTAVHHEHGGAPDAAARARIARKVYEGRWRFNLVATRGWRRVVIVAVGSIRTAAESARKRSPGPLLGYLAALRAAPVLLRPRNRFDLRSRR
jgi:GT2 family glycosyltransferase